MPAAFLNRVPRWVRRSGLVVLLLAFVWSASALWLPALLKPQLERRVGEALGRTLQIGAIEFRPWSLELTVRDLVLRGRDGASEQLSVQELYANLAAKSLLRLAPVIDELSIDRPQLHLTQTAPGHYDIDDILAKLSAPPSTSASTGEPAPFAVYNLSLNGGGAEFVDQVVGKTHTVRDLQIGIPFVSNFPADREILTEPRLAFQLNGSAFDSAAQSTPFVDSRKTDLRLNVQQLDLKTYLAYLPPNLPVALAAGLLDADLRVRFEQTPKPSLVLDGRLGLQKLAINDASKGDLLQIERIGLSITELRPFERVAKFDSLEIVAPRLSVRRDPAGRLNVVGSTGVPPASPAAPASPASSAASRAAAPAQPWTVSLAKADVRDGLIHWRDEAASPGAPTVSLALNQLALQVEDLQFPFQHPLRLNGSARLVEQDRSSDGAAPADLAFAGSATDTAVDVRVTLERATLRMAAPYLAGVLKPRLSGDVSADMALNWKADAGLVAAVERLTVSQLALDGTPRDRTSKVAAGAPVQAQEVGLGKLEVRKAHVDLARRAVDIDVVSLDRPRVAVARAKNGRWMFEDWMPEPRAGTAPAAAGPAASTAPAWTVALANLEIDDGAVAYADQFVARPVALAVSALQVRANGLHSDLGKPMRVQLSAAVRSGEATPGRIGFSGQVTPAPALAQGEVDVKRFPVHALEPYFGDALNLRVARADTSYKGTLKFASAKAGPSVQLAGDLGVEDFRAQQGANRDLLTWNVLRLRGLAVDVKPGAAASVAVQETTLSDFYARVIVDETGRINLQDLTKPGPAPTAVPVAASAPAAPSPPPQGAPANIRFGPIQLQNGRVLFSDRFIKPNYTANLTELNGRLSEFASAGTGGAAPALADLELRGRAEGTASLEITGKLNPLAKPLALDIRAKVRDLELPPLSPYSVKYAGHGIERGKLSVDVHYEVLPSGQLTASNSLVLNQLTFGDAVPGAPASLPVRLATALLSDRNGVIDLNLPIQGSLNDPQFSLGPVILKAIVNLIVKAVTAPFSLLASAFGGGGEELGKIDFAPGSAALDAAAEQRLDKVATALTDRPALKLSVAGSASLEAEREGLKKARLQRMVQAEKRRGAVERDAPPARPGSRATVEISAAEYPVLLKALYQRTDLPDKPRNPIGMAKDLPVPEMESLLLSNMTVTEDAIRNLATQRGVAVRDYLASRDIPLERLFLGAAKAVSAEGSWSPHADLDLATP